MCVAHLPAVPYREQRWEPHEAHPTLSKLLETPVHPAGVTGSTYCLRLISSSHNVKFARPVVHEHIIRLHGHRAVLRRSGLSHLAVHSHDQQVLDDRAKHESELMASAHQRRPPLMAGGSRAHQVSAAGSYIWGEQAFDFSAQAAHSSQASVGPPRALVSRTLLSLNSRARSRLLGVISPRERFSLRSLDPWLAAVVLAPRQIGLSSESTARKVGSRCVCVVGRDSRSGVCDCMWFSCCSGITLGCRWQRISSSSSQTSCSGHASASCSGDASASSLIYGASAAALLEGSDCWSTSASRRRGCGRVAARRVACLRVSSRWDASRLYALIRRIVYLGRRELIERPSVGASRSRRVKSIWRGSEGSGAARLLSCSLSVVSPVK
ncbi:unnamed protein product [Boreogadus saida]